MINKSFDEFFWQRSMLTLHMLSSENSANTPEVSSRTIRHRFHVDIVEGLFPRSGNHTSDGFHTQFDGSPLFCRGSSSPRHSERDPFERRRRPRQLHRMRWSPVGSAIILQSQVRSQHHLTGGSLTLLALYMITTWICTLSEGD